MIRIKYTETRIVNGVEFIVEAIDRLEYNGQWIDNGYNVKFNNIQQYFFGYPTNTDLKKLIDKGSVVK